MTSEVWGVCDWWVQVKQEADWEHASRSVRAQSPHATFPQRIVQIARHHPDAVAVVAGSQVLSYGELNCRANQIAQRLRRWGIGRGHHVALYQRRDAAMIVGLLGIAKTGAAYVPIDPAYPLDRCLFMMHDADVRAVVTCTGMLPPDHHLSVPILCTDDEAARLEQESDAEPPIHPEGTDLAYIVYTSGTTGLPKGVEVTHAALCALIDWHTRAFAVTSHDRASQIASPAFDAAVWEIWPHLANGASVSIVEDEIRADPERLRDWFIREHITVAFVPTPLAERMIVLIWPESVALRVMLTGGDALHSYPPASLPFPLINNYGPSETTVVATSGIVPPDDHPLRPPTIGTPIDHTRIYLLDEQRQPVPTGTPGEMYIGGQSVAHGYYRRPDLTAERFLPDPFAGDPDARMYRTGDQAQWLPDGQLAFLGRTDFQVNIRGYRIELEEIAAVLNTAPLIGQSVVTVEHPKDGEPRLIAYCTFATAAIPHLSALQDHLRQRLPDYMIPATFVRIDTLPMTANGKVDRAALPKPDPMNQLRDVIALPTSPIEMRLATIIGELLELETISVDENFFLLGGHSLLGAQLLALIAQAYGVTLPLRQLFATPTIRELSAIIEQRFFQAIQVMSDEDVAQLLQQESGLLRSTVREEGSHHV